MRAFGTYVDLRDPISLIPWPSRTGLFLAVHQDRRLDQTPFPVLLLHEEDLYVNYPRQGEPPYAVNTRPMAEATLHPEAGFRRAALAGIINQAVRIKNPESTFVKFFKSYGTRTTRYDVHQRIAAYEDQLSDSRFRTDVADKIMAEPKGFTVYGKGDPHYLIEGNNLGDALERLYQVTKNPGFLQLKEAHQGYLTEGYLPHKPRQISLEQTFQLRK